MPVEPKPTITAEEIAALLGLKLDTFQKLRRKLMQDGMPRPVPGLALVWSRRNILLWIDGDLAPAGEEAA